MRAELFNVAQLQRHARTMAGWHEVTKPRDPRSRRGDGLLARLADNEAVLREAYALLTEAVARGRQITPAAEWLIDNFHLIEQQVRTARKHLPHSYQSELPRLANGSSPGTPRVYDLAFELISHAHGRVDAETLGAFVAAYQEVEPLQLGELWAIPIMLRLSLLENMRRVVTAITEGRRERERAAVWVDEMIEVASTDPSCVVLVLAEIVEEDLPLTDAFVAELASRLQGQGPALAVAMSWVEHRLAERGQTIDHVFELASQSQAADQVSIGNSIGSLRLLSATDWREFVESMSAVEHVLREDPSGAYPTMDFATRDRYRHVVEAIARRSPDPESEVARAAIALAREATGRRAHVGYFLVEDGRSVLERVARMRRGPRLVVRRLVGRMRLGVYASAITLATGIVTAILSLATPFHVAGGWQVAWIALLAICASQVAVAVVHWAATLLVPPQSLPRLDFTTGIPDAHRTLVAVPTMLTDLAEIDELVELLEVRYLANRDANLSFALVTDFRDAATEVTATDEGLLARARDRIDALNARYAPGCFFLFHRSRRWNAREGVWMGWERKRGKLEQLNTELRGEHVFETVVGPVGRLVGTQYVIVLDSDTALPRDTARLLAATLGHPLNRPCVDAASGRVVAGYGILQPRVGVSMASTTSSRFARLFGGQPGIDPYTRAVSDVYQDVFGDGSFVGKGIYDIDAFRQALHGRFPENRVLSHDLIEGAYAHAGLVSDVLLVEDYPTSHAADIIRRARWIRGDWQIAVWLRRNVPTATTRARNSISLLSQWKVLDNLRRSVVPIALMTLLVVGWLQPGGAWFATLAVAAIVVLPGLLSAAAALARGSKEHTRRQHAGEIAGVVVHQLAREAFGLACLPHDAWVSLTAIARTLGRIYLTGRRLLQWRTASDAGRSQSATLPRAYLAMWIGPLGAIGAAILIARQDPHAAIAAAPILAAWLIAPGLAWWLSLPVVPAAPRLSREDQAFLHQVARKTWRFFEVMVTAADNDLPPDNFQEEPARGVARRTSPTNIGLALTANLAAYDFGYIAAGELVARTARTLGSLDRMQRYRGHFFNWYDTETLEPLRPMYVSTVDSGNLAGHLLTLAVGLDELEQRPIVGAPTFDGLRATLTILAEHVSQLPVAARPEEGARTDVARRVERLRGELDARCDTLAEIEARLHAVAKAADALVTAVGATADPDVAWWANAFAAQCTEAVRELVELAPWLALPGPPSRYDGIRSLAELARLESTLVATDPAELQGAVSIAAERAAVRIGHVRALAARCRELADLDYEFLYDRQRHLFSIGYSVSEHRLDASYYDLLASEARLASYIAIAQGKLPQEHWFSLGRLLTTSHGKPALLSWSGSMFEYLMPLLIMPSYERTLLDDTCRAVVARQIAYGRERGVPWGVSESGYDKTDAQLNYQYRAFGVPGLGFQRGLGEELVIAPYASAMALVVDPAAACANLERLADDGQLGAYGFYEAIDYTPARLASGKRSTTVRSFMAHHQGMTFLALAYVLLDRPMQRRFTTDLAFRATDLLLQERVPRVQAIYPHPAEVSPAQEASLSPAAALRVYTTPNTPRPAVHLLSNGHYHVAVTNAGGGYSRWRDIAVTRWHEDATRDCWGTFGYLRDVTSGAFWSVAHQPTLARASRYEAIFSQGRAEFRRFDREIETHVEIAVSPEDDIELRRITLTNASRTERTLELTSFAEIVLTQAAADAAHPAFSNLFVQTEVLAAQQAILCTRRPRSGSERPPWMVHLMTVHGATVGETSYETARTQFIGRGRSASDPIAMYREALTNTDGSVLDPIVAIRNRVVLAPDAMIRIHFVTGVAETREGALALIEKYRDRNIADRVFELAWTHGQVVQRRLDATNADIQLYERLASHILYATSARRAPKSLLARNRGAQSALWAYGISGDVPIVLVRISDLVNIELVRHLVKAHAYWRLKGLTADLVIWNEDPSGYRQVLQDTIMAIIASASVAEASVLDKPGGIFVRRTEQFSEDDKILMQTVARVILDASDGSLVEQMERKPRIDAPQPEAVVPRRAPVAVAAIERPDLVAFNGRGGFTSDGREYVITTAADARTPAPWSNVLANPYFGTVVTESGGGYTWCENAHSYRLTPWHNDAVSDVTGEALYVRDDETGAYWSPTPLPAVGTGPYTSRHGFGYSVFENTTAGIATELTTFVATDAPLKFLVLKLRNTSGRPRRLSVLSYFELVLGSNRAVNAPHVIVELDLKTAGLLARNAYNAELAHRVAFLDCSEVNRTVTGDRLEFLGRNGSPAHPACMARPRLSGRAGAGLDPCLAMQTTIELADGQEREVVFTFGSGRDLADARHLVMRFRGTGAARTAIEGVWAYWNKTLGTVHVQTPDPALDFLANGWLLYQVLACRMWGRSGFYQSGGAFGFRDQLQDALALVHAEPALLRAQILLVASRQFSEGDVQHWWHPPLGRGVRTRISDDYLFLPYAVCRYVAALGDTGVLDEKLAFLVGRPVNADEDSYYDLPGRSDETATVYEHCRRAIRHGLRFGEHGLPLMGSGDWNDGMNLVGDHGKGESVWLAFFLYDVLVKFGELATRCEDPAFAALCASEAVKLRDNIEQHAWDGAWYRRAYFDDGTPLGSAQNPECQIDSLPQSWSMLSHAGDPDRSRQGLAAVDARLVRRDLGLIQLFDPPFASSALEPGYIKGYVPGVRENGGQYTHAAVWAAMAFAVAGDRERAWELFNLINPIHHGDSAAAIETYKVEPYVVAADIYTNPQHAGRGGWTWYTGSAAWMYQLITESLLGIRLVVDQLHVAPLLPASWPGFALHYRHRETVYHIEVKNLGGDGRTVRRVTCDGVDQPAKTIPLRDDRREHRAEIEVGSS